ncbi:hypothetical protein [Methylobacterium oxalidis]|uniref:Uncharacterized protein n=1 Tax=Methylobacterium oxalidis TaxID=944322 RepID=A0A512JDE2_9HYPH|nr:hypothetical protein [Methylobacterium oxalidis]GEP07937.1 hypothetical protein MOX02_59750 [Methylobacterium oxalidis]GJE35746.1 hypothetical protein LDDCCGHA_5966 [Methylobacterium oxalidis]GLS66017.1 hypothetical protein GCM10007888_43990 [Methylobacterium oxalidis]
MARREVTDLLERDPRQEERAGIDLEGLLAVLDETGYRGDPRLEVLGEIVSSRGGRFPNDARIQIVALNDKDQVIGLADTSVSQGDPGYEAFAEAIELQGWPTRIRIVVSCR